MVNHAVSDFDNQLTCCCVLDLSLRAWTRSHAICRLRDGLPLDYEVLNCHAIARGNQTSFPAVPPPRISYHAGSVCWDWVPVLRRCLTSFTEVRTDVPGPGHCFLC